MTALYHDDMASNLKINGVIGSFLWGNLRNFGKRLFYNYFLRDFSAASVELIVGSMSVVFGIAFGTTQWITAAANKETATAGTVMLGALPVIVGLYLLLSFLNFDVQSVPRRPVYPDLIEMRKTTSRQASP